MTANILLIYQVFEKNEIFKNNIKIFINSISHTKDVDYLLLLTGDTSIQYPQYENVKYFYFSNQGLDYGAYQRLFSFYKINSKYNYIVFLNSSVLGPIFRDQTNWVNHYISLLSNQVKLVGSSINDCGQIFSSTIKYFEQQSNSCVPHVQSYIFVMERPTLEYLISKNLFKEVYLGRDEIIREFEMKMSRLILEKDWNIGSILKDQTGEYNKWKFNCNPSSKIGDPLYKNGYYSRTLLPDELVFIKPERNLYNYCRLLNMMFSFSPQTKSIISKSSIFKLSLIIYFNSLFLRFKENIKKWIL
jgi:hypothetical protein